MAYSGEITNTTFNALKVVDHAFRRCRLPAQAITAEMHDYAVDTLNTTLAELASVRTPSWCIEKIILPMYENQPVVTLPLGTVDVLNLNYRILQPVSGTVVAVGNAWTTSFTTATVVDTVGIRWSGPSVPIYFQVSDDGINFTTVGSSSAQATSGEITWSDISGAVAHLFFKIVCQDLDDALFYTSIFLGNMPQEIPLGQLNRDGYVNQSNKVFPGRPSNFYYQRDLPQPIVRIWPAPFAAAEQAQLILWRHRQIMSNTNLQQDVEIPSRWLEAIINTLAARVAAETPQVDPSIMAVLEQKSAMSMQRAWDGDNDGSPIQINPGIGAYTA